MFAKGDFGPKMQRSLLQFFKPEIVYRPGRTHPGLQARPDRHGCDCLIPAQPPKEARRTAPAPGHDRNSYRTVANPAKGEKALGIRPAEQGLTATQGRKSARRAARTNDTSVSPAAPAPQP